MIVLVALLSLDGYTGTGTDVAHYSRYRTMETAATRLQKESKGYLDSLRGGWPFALRIVESRCSVG
jgi:hypothetical protein